MCTGRTIYHIDHTDHPTLSRLHENHIRRGSQKRRFSRIHAPRAPTDPESGGGAVSRAARLIHTARHAAATAGAAEQPPLAAESLHRDEAAK